MIFSHIKIRGWWSVLGIGISVYRYYQMWNLITEYRITEWLLKLPKYRYRKLGWELAVFWYFEPFWKPFDALKAFWRPLKAFWWPLKAFWRLFNGILKAFKVFFSYRTFKNSTEILDTESWGKKYCPPLCKLNFQKQSRTFNSTEKNKWKWSDRGCRRLSTYHIIDSWG